MPKKPTSSLLENLIEKQKESELREIAECHLYTDATVRGQVILEDSPYEVLNTCVLDEENIVLPRLIFRYKDYRPGFSTPTCPLEFSNEKIEADSLLEGNIGEQMSVLISLILGIRIKSSAPNRSYTPNCGSELGNVKYFSVQDDPRPIKLVSGKIILPNAIRKNISIPKSQYVRYLDSLNDLANQKDMINTLLRSAKLYRDALWIIESEPSLSWLMLVSAIETAAQYEFDAQNNEKNNFEIIHDLDDKLATIIKKCCTENGKEIIAKEFIDKECATKKFIKFLEKYLPEPPAERPPEAFQLDWSWGGLEDPLKKIYRYRSEALHGGRNFPEDMCEPAPRSDDGRLHENPFPLASIRIKNNKAHGIRNAPSMFIHIFEHIVRNSLLRWWGRFLK